MERSVSLILFYGLDPYLRERSINIRADDYTVIGNIISRIWIKRVINNELPATWFGLKDHSQKL